MMQAGETSMRRKGDGLDTRSWFRSDRMFLEGRKWYFQTREGTVEGPYEDRMMAARMLDSYMMVMNSSFSPGGGLSIQEDSAYSVPSGPPGEKKLHRKADNTISIPAFSLEPISN